MLAFVFLFAATLITPPLLLLVALSHRSQRLRARGQPRLGWWIAAAVAVVATAYQAAISVGLLVQSFSGLVDLNFYHVIGLLIAWVSLCFRIAMRRLPSIRRPRN